MKIQVSAEIDSAHRLTFHDGKCRNLHGHRWGIKVRVKSKLEWLPGERFLIDFGKIKNIIRHLDHCVLVWEGDRELIDACNLIEARIVVLPFETTAENIAEYLRAKVVEELAAKFASKWTLKVEVEVAETATGIAISGEAE